VNRKRREVSPVRELRDSIDIDVPPERVWHWLTGLADHYREWHPAHVSAEWEHGEPNQIGSVLEVVEDLAGHRERLRFEITAVEPPHRIEYRLLGGHALVIPRGAFDISRADGHTRFTATLSYRLGPLVERALRRRVVALRAHMREEGRRLKQILESVP
jgi:uncharacterized protein YndB with AHSA1/START domain